MLNIGFLSSTNGCHTVIVVASWLLISSIVHYTCEAEEPAPAIVSLDEERTTGSLIAIDSTWQLRFVTPSGERSLSARRLVSWGKFSDRSVGTHVILTDGSILVAEILSISDKTIALESTTFGDLSVALEHVSGIVFAPPINASARDQLIDRIRETAGSEDQLLLTNGDLVRGIVSHKGQVGPRRADDLLEKVRIRLRDADDEIAISIEKLTAVIFDPALRKTTASRGLRCHFGLDDGSLLKVAEIHGEATDQVRLVCGATLPTEEGTLVDAAAWLQPMGGDCVYLSDLKPLSYKHIPFLNRQWNYGVDRNVLQGRLRTAAGLHLKGIGMHSMGRLAYVVPRGTKRFAAEVAIDAASENQGSVAFRLFTNSGDGWSEAFKSETIRGGESPTPISIDVSKARGILLVVDFADRGDIMDHANWLNARFER